jgi:hypothetical protein
MLALAQVPAAVCICQACVLPTPARAVRADVPVPVQLVAASKSALGIVLGLGQAALGLICTWSTSSEYAETPA